MRDGSSRERRTVRSVRIGLALALLLTTLPLGAAQAGEPGRLRCETRVEPRAIFGRNYVLDRVQVCGPAADPVEAAPVSRERAAPPTVFGAPLDPELGRVSWDASRAQLANTQYERTVRAGRRGFSGRDR